MPIDESRLAELLDAQGIRYARFEHAPVFTCDEVERAVPPEAPGVQTKNLFLRDKRGRRHWLLVTTCEKAVDLRALGDRLDEHLSFGSPDRLMRYLGVTPGAVTILALANDPERQVELLVDADVWRAAAIRAHPLVNTATLVIGHEELSRFLASTGHAPAVIDVPTRSG